MLTIVLKPIHMEAQYSNLPYMSTFDARHEIEIPSDTGSSDEGAPMARTTSLGVWISACWALATHCILSIGIAVFVLAYIHDRHFNLTERTPLVHIAGGTQVSPIRPMQSDIVTFLSSMIAVMKCVLATWAGSLCWHIALFLMGRRGLSHGDLKVLLKYGLLAPSAYLRDWSTVITASLLLTSLTANPSSPILTGSISWLPSNRLMRSLNTGDILVPAIENGNFLGLFRLNRDYYSLRDGTVLGGVGNVGMAWGRNTDKGAFKQVPNSVETLSINSTVKNITLPYFQVHSIRWIEIHDDIPGIINGFAPTRIISAHFQTTPTTIFSSLPGVVVLLPNATTNWSSDPLDSTTIHDTRLLVLYDAYDQADEQPLPGTHMKFTQDLPPNVCRVYDQKTYYTFAWVTFSAGVGRCKDYHCVISSPSTIRNNTPIELEPHRLTFQALSMAPVIGAHLVAQNTSLPYSWNNINDYIEAILVRSYSGAWISLNSMLQTSNATTRYIPSLPSLLANVDQSRVFIWLGIQLLVSLLSVLFLIVQSSLSKYPQIGDITFTAFFMDTTGIPGGNTTQFQGKGLLKIEPLGDRFKVKLE